MSMAFPVVIADTHCHNAECPIWDEEQQYLYWTDIPRGRLYRYEFMGQTYKEIHRGMPIGGLCLQRDGALLLFRAHGRIERWHWGDLEPIIEAIPAEMDSRFNDVIADPLGRVFCGTMATQQHPGKLYRLDPDGYLEIVLDDVQIPNGMGFSKDETRFYFTDSPTRSVSVFDYDKTSGQISNHRPLFILPPDQGVPDGLVVDGEDHIWSARWDGGHLFRYNPDGQEVLKIPFPARKVSSLTFGGPKLDQIYATTAGGQDRPHEGDGAGAIFRLDINIPGKPEYRSCIAPT
jgi:D-xylono/L-arabinono-1,4-lactonase